MVCLFLYFIHVNSLELLAPMRASRQALAAAALGLAGVLLLARSSTLALTTSYARPRVQSVWDAAASVADEAVGHLGAVAATVADAAISIANGVSPDAGVGTDVQSAVDGFRASMGGPRTPSVPSRQPADAAGESREPLLGPCLVRRWSAIWLLHPNHTRSYVRVPTPGCDARASAVTTAQLDQWPLAFSQMGSYTMSADESVNACKALGCSQAVLKLRTPTKLPAASTQRPAAAAARPDAVPSAVHPAHPHASPAWMRRSTLLFNDAARASLAARQPGETILVVFGGASVNDMLRNWAIHAQTLGMPFVVACMDEQLFKRSEAGGLPAVLMKQTRGESNLVSTKWKYYRMDPKAFLTMGLLKVSAPSVRPHSLALPQRDSQRGSSAHPSHNLPARPAPAPRSAFSSSS